MESPAPEILKKPENRKKNFLIFGAIILALILISTLLVYFGKFNLSFFQTQGPGRVVETKKVTEIETSPLLSNQTALARGTIISKTENEISIKGENGQTDTFELKQPVVIYNQATSSATLGSIELDKPAVITLELKDNKYKVISISYFIPPPPPGS